jgi:hypothetical protein
LEKRKEHVIRMRDGEVVLPDTGDQVMDRISDLQKPPHQGTTAKAKANSIGVSPILTELAYVENTDVFTRLKTSSDGLSRAEAEARMVEYGPKTRGSFRSKTFHGSRGTSARPGRARFLSLSENGR